MVELVAERGFRRVTVRELSRLAGVSTKTFYDCFANVDDCFAATHARIVRDAVRPASIDFEDDEARLRARIRDLFASLGADPKAARLVLVESLSVGPAALDRANGLNRGLERLVRDEMADPGRPVPVQPALAHGIVSAALRVLRAHPPDRQDELPQAADRFSEWLLTLKDSRLLNLSGRPTGRLGSQYRALQPGPKGDERQLLLSAVAKLCALDGYENLTVPAIRREAGVPRRIFDQHFDGVEDCFLAAIETRLAAATRRAEAEAAETGSWERGVIHAIAALAFDFARDPFLARFGLIDVLAPGHSGLELRENIIVCWARHLRRSAPRGLYRDALTSEASVAAAWGIAEAKAAAGRSGRIRAAVPSMAFVVLAPVIGPKAAEAAILAELYPS